MHGPGLINRFRLNTKRLVAEIVLTGEGVFGSLLFVQKKRQIIKFTLDEIMDNKNIVCPRILELSLLFLSSFILHYA